MTEEKKSESRTEDSTQARAAQPSSKAAAPAAAAGATAVAVKAEPEKAAASPEAAVELTREEQAKALMYKYMMQNAALGLLPIPVVDVLTIGGTQLAMLGAISKVYGIDYHHNMAKPIVASLLGALGYDFAVRGIAGALVKTVPVFGLLVGIASMPIMGAASTYAVAKIFIQHFESGGTFINFDANEAKKYFSQYYKEGLQEAISMKDRLLKPKAPKAPGEGKPVPEHN
jgi:uncharacterized protein (DUF697 family)